MFDENILEQVFLYDPNMVQQLDLSLNYARLLCPDLVEQNITESILPCVTQAARGQNMIDLFLKLKMNVSTMNLGEDPASSRLG